MILDLLVEQICWNQFFMEGNWVSKWHLLYTKTCDPSRHYRLRLLPQERCSPLFHWEKERCENASRKLCEPQTRISSPASTLKGPLSCSLLLSSAHLSLFLEFYRFVLALCLFSNEYFFTPQFQCSAFPIRVSLFQTNFFFFFCQFCVWELLLLDRWSSFTTFYLKIMMP